MLAVIGVAGFLTRLLAPLFSLPYQTYCTNQALKHVKKILEMNQSIL